MGWILVIGLNTAIIALVTWLEKRSKKFDGVTH